MSVAQGWRAEIRGPMHVEIVVPCLQHAGVGLGKSMILVCRCRVLKVGGYQSEWPRASMHRGVHSGVCSDIEMSSWVLLSLHSLVALKVLADLLRISFSFVRCQHRVRYLR